MLGENCTFNNDKYDFGLGIIVAHCLILIFIDDYISQRNGQQNNIIVDSMDVS